MEIMLRDAREDDFGAILSLNDAEVQHTSEMDIARLRELAAMATYQKVACLNRRVVAFLLAMSHDAPYRNDNFAWFSARFAKFIYVDRIVIDKSCAGLGTGTLLYEDLFRYARSAAIGVITCEYNIEPPNHASRRFHDKFGFREIGTRWVEAGVKRVSLQATDA